MPEEQKGDPGGWSRKNNGKEVREEGKSQIRQRLVSTDLSGEVTDWIYFFINMNVAMWR